MSDIDIPRRVAVLLSTYNGEKYIIQQLDSLKSQLGNLHIDIHIRDDGSKDNTCDLLKSYLQKENNIYLYEEVNIGVVASFLYLVDNVVGYDYYAFCDQDDIWKPLKIISAIQKIEELEQDTPALYCSAYDYVDQDLKPLGTFKSGSDFSLNNILIENCAPGCTLLFNNKMRDVYKNISGDDLSRKAIMHDWLFIILAGIFGKILYDYDSYLLYRQHENNVVGIKNGFISVFRAKVKQFLKERRKQRHPLNIQMQLISQCCKSNKEDLAYIISSKFNSSQLNLFNRVAFVSKGYIKRVKFIDDVIFKTLYVFGYFK